MPSIEELRATADMEQLVTRLSSQLKVRSGKPPRPSPYRRDQKPINHQISPDDPYEMLQSLLKSQSLIKEAVRRLGCKKEYFYSSEEEDCERIELKFDGTSAAGNQSGKNEYFYDSEDDERSARRNNQILYYKKN